jgi:hypothetical protein
MDQTEIWRPKTRRTNAYLEGDAWIRHRVPAALLTWGWLPLHQAVSRTLTWGWPQLLRDAPNTDPKKNMLQTETKMQIVMIHTKRMRTSNSRILNTIFPNHSTANPTVGH